MKVMFVSINKLKSYRPVLPIGMVTVATQVAMAGHEVRCVDLMFEDEDQEVIQREVRAFQPEALGISVRNVDSLNFLEPAIYTPLAREVTEWARALIPDLKVVLGGAGFTTIPEDMMDFVDADYGILGFAEESFSQLIGHIERSTAPDDIQGIIFPRADGSFFIKPPSFHIDYSKVAIPNKDFYDPRYFSYTFETHEGVERVAQTIQTKKGCVLECIFCSNFLIDGTGVKFNEVGIIVDEIQRIIDDGAPCFEIVDGVFNLPLHHAIELLEEMRRRRIHHPWSCMINPGAVNARLVGLMAETGCHEVELGTDSCSNQVLSTLKKNFRKKHVYQVHKMFEAAGMRIMHCLFIGSPEDDADTVFETFDVMDELVPPGHRRNRVYWTFGLRICRGTTLFDRAVSEGVVRSDERFIIPKYYVSPKVLHDEHLLDRIEARVLRNTNGYLWWGIPNISLKQRIKQAREEHRRIESLYLDCFAKRVTKQPMPSLVVGP